MARALLGPAAEVIMSSEWDFSPLTYPMTVSVLPEHVLIGMPSSESSNALILPLAGHELGHSVWRKEQLESKWAREVHQGAKDCLQLRWSDFQRAFPEHAAVKPTDTELANNMFLVHVQSDIVGLTLNQIEEIFCDAVGSHLFGPSYACAFHYLLAPSLGGTRPIEYPPLAIRATLLASCSGINLNTIGFPAYAAEFQDVQPSLAPRDDFISRAADEIAKKLSQRMYDDARALVMTKARAFTPDYDSELAILRMFEAGIPSQSPRSLADILNASWTYVRDKASGFDEDERPLLEWISELALKSIEVLEYRSRIGHA